MNVATSDTAAASRLVAAFERIWAAIRANHPDVPELVIVVAADQLDDLGALDSGGRAGVVWRMDSHLEGRALILGVH